MIANKRKKTKVAVIADFDRMKEILEQTATPFHSPLKAYNIKVFDRTITRYEDF